jgi:hypothetical protein
MIAMATSGRVQREDPGKRKVDADEAEHEAEARSPRKSRSCSASPSSRHSTPWSRAMSGRISARSAPSAGSIPKSVSPSAHAP